MSVNEISNFLTKNGWVYFYDHNSPTDKIDVLNKLVNFLNPNEKSHRNWEIINIPEFRSLLLTPTILGVLEKIYKNKNNFNLTSFSTYTVVDSNPIHWHVDYPFSENDLTDTKIPKSVQVNIALTDFTEENGATMFVEGSHKFNRKPTLFEFSEHKCFVVPKGTVMMYFGNLWHSVGVNTTNKPRNILLSNFSSSEYKPLEMWDKKDKRIDKQISENDKDFYVENERVKLR